MNVSIIGAGSWGTALAQVLLDNQHNVLIYDIDTKVVNEINTLHTNNTKLPNILLPESLVATANLKELCDFSDIMLVSVPTKVMRITLRSLNEYLSKPIILINTSKGIEPDTFKLVSEIAKEEIKDGYLKGFVALTGPSHAEEVILRLPTLITSASENIEYAKLIQSLFSNQSYFRVYTLIDLRGAELGGALKNIYAVAAGMIEGLGYGDNAKAALISRALVEMKRLAIAKGASDETLNGLTGLGDLVVTTTSHHSRNFQAGLKLAAGKNLEEAISSIPMVVEGARTVLSAYIEAHRLDIRVPLIDAVYSVIYEKTPVEKAVEAMMGRSLKDEFK